MELIMKKIAITTIILCVFSVLCFLFKKELDSIDNF
jgi:hypothetical protein